MGFNRGVWSRIHAPEDSHRFVQFFRFSQALPLAACVTVLLSLAVGSGSALVLNHAQSAERMASAYVLSIDPVQLAADHALPHTHS
jgi:hypothetical protein